MKHRTILHFRTLALAACAATALLGCEAKDTRPAMPVLVSYRESSVGEGLVAVFRNPTDRHLTIVFSVENPTVAKTDHFTLDLNPHTSQDFGWMEGWRFASGDKLTLRHHDYITLNLAVP